MLEVGRPVVVQMEHAGATISNDQTKGLLGKAVGL